MIDHDVKPGPLNRCQVCGSEDLRLIIDLGHQPLCDALLTKEELQQPEITYPLRLNQCERCSLAQLDYVVSAAKVYPVEYPYRAGISWPVVAAHKVMAENLVNRFGAGLCVDIGSNDGTLLAQFKELGCDVIGIEPTGIAHIARAAGVPTINDFFKESYALGIVADHGRAHLITMTNVFAHMADLGEVMRGVCALIADDGVLVIENHYLLDILECNQFDSIYHEHIRTYTLKSLRCLFQQYGFEIFDVDRVPRYGGNIRVYATRRKPIAISARVGDLLRREDERGLNTESAWYKFCGDVYNARYQYQQFMVNNDDDVVGCSAPGRASTLLNYYGVEPEAMRWTGELEGSLKIGKYIPGCHIPIVSNRRIVEEQPEYVVLLAWHYGTEIQARLRKEGVKSKLILPLPEFTIRDQIGMAA